MSNDSISDSRSGLGKRPIAEITLASLGLDGSMTRCQTLNHWIRKGTDARKDPNRSVGPFDFRWIRHDFKPHRPLEEMKEELEADHNQEALWCDIFTTDTKDTDATSVLMCMRRWIKVLDEARVPYFVLMNSGEYTDDVGWIWTLCPSSSEDDPHYSRRLRNRDGRPLSWTYGAEDGFPVQAEDAV